MTTPTNSDMEKLLAQEPYLGAKHLQSQYEEVWAVMGQESFINARKTLRKAKKGVDVHYLFLREAKDITGYVVHHLERLSQAEFALTFAEGCSEEKNKQIRDWCGELSRTYSPLMILLEDTA